MPEVGEHPQATVRICVIEEMRMRTPSPSRFLESLDNRCVGMATGHRPVPEMPFNDFASKQNLDTGMLARGLNTSEHARQTIGRPLDVLEESPTVVQQRSRHAVHPVVDHCIYHQAFKFGVGEAAYRGASIDEGL